MSKIDLKGVCKVRSKGHTYYYAWRGGPRLPGPPGSPEFLIALANARNPINQLNQAKFGTWIAKFRESEMPHKAKSTKRVWESWLVRIDEEFGDLPVKAFKMDTMPALVTAWRGKWRSKPRQMDYAKQVLSAVCSFAVENGGITKNPCIGLKNTYEVDRSAIIWTPEDIKAFCDKASKEVAWVVRLAALTGLRQGDLLRLSWSHIDDLAVEIKTSKSKFKKRATIPMTSALRDLLKEIPRYSTVVLTNSHRRPWTMFSSSYNKVMRDSGLKAKGLHFHDLRGTAATHLYRSGFTVQEIAQIMGWDEKSVTEIIDRYVNRDEIMRDRIRRLEAGDRK